MLTLLALLLVTPSHAVWSNKYKPENHAFTCTSKNAPGKSFDILTDAYTTTGYGKWTGNINRLWVVTPEGVHEEMQLAIPKGLSDMSLGTYKTDGRSLNHLLLDIKGRGQNDIQLEDSNTHQVYECYSMGDCC